VGLIGDAAHATTPHLASGAGLAVEDGLVLAYEMLAADSVAAGWHAFAERRWERSRLVVQTSVRLGQMEIDAPRLQSRRRCSGPLLPRWRSRSEQGGGSARRDALVGLAQMMKNDREMFYAVRAARS
jgi:2-polyprenyl-6-methoxyphenol hydroxylase-like FAD-dependent oxidoreductase